MIKAHCEVAHG
jgi:hypothetical protein